jgi:hypothetical protein
MKTFITSPVTGNSTHLVPAISSHPPGASYGADFLVLSNGQTWLKFGILGLNEPDRRERELRQAEPVIWAFGYRTAVVIMRITEGLYRSKMEKGNFDAWWTRASWHEVTSSRNRNQIRGRNVYLEVFLMSRAITRCALATVLTLSFSACSAQTPLVIAQKLCDRMNQSMANHDLNQLLALYDSTYILMF